MIGRLESVTDLNEKDDIVGRMPGEKVATELQEPARDAATLGKDNVGRDDDEEDNEQEPYAFYKPEIFSAFHHAVDRWRRHTKDPMYRFYLVLGQTELQFKPILALKTLIYEVFPATFISAPLCILLDGRIAARNRLLLCSPSLMDFSLKRLFFMNELCALCIFFVWTSFLVCHSQGTFVTSGDKVRVFELILVTLLWCLRCLVVSFRYGYVSNDLAYGKFSVNQADFKSLYHRQLPRMLYSWGRNTETDFYLEIMAYQLILAQVRANIDLKEAYFVVGKETSLRIWEQVKPELEKAIKCYSFGAEHGKAAFDFFFGTPQLIESHAVCGRILASVMAYKALLDNMRNNPKMEWLVTSISLCFAFAGPALQIIVRALAREPVLGIHPIAVAIRICGIYVSWYTAFLLGGYLSTIVVDYHRRYDMAKWLTGLISNGVPVEFSRLETDNQSYNEYMFETLRQQEALDRSLQEKRKRGAGTGAGSSPTAIAPLANDDEDLTKSQRAECTYGLPHMLTSKVPLVGAMAITDKGDSKNAKKNKVAVQPDKKGPLYHRSSEIGHLSPAQKNVQLPDSKDVKKPESSTCSAPKLMRVDIRRPENLISWAICRRSLMTEYGKSYSSRFNLVVVSTFMSAALLLAVISLTTYITQTENRDGEDLLTYEVILHAGVIAVVSMNCVFRMTLKGFKANHEIEVIKTMLSKERLAIRMYFTEETTRDRDQSETVTRTGGIWAGAGAGVEKAASETAINVGSSSHYHSVYASLPEEAFFSKDLASMVNIVRGYVSTHKDMIKVMWFIADFRVMSVFVTVLSTLAGIYAAVLVKRMEH